MANWKVIEFKNYTWYKWDKNRQHFSITDLVDSSSSQIALALIKRDWLDETVLKYIHLEYPWLKDKVNSLKDIRIVSYDYSMKQLLFEINWELKHLILAETSTYLDIARKKERLANFISKYWDSILSHFDNFSRSDLWKIEDFTLSDSIIYFSVYWHDFACYNWHNRELIELLLSQWIRLWKKVFEERELQNIIEEELNFLEERWKCIAIIETWFPHIKLDEIEDIAFPNKDNQMIYFRYRWTIYSVLAYTKSKVEESFIGYIPYPHLYSIK